jgi:hypothetical protein
MKLKLARMALALPRVRSHPNRQPFRGVLTLVDSASDRPPAGARGHRVILTRAAAERAIPSLLGMGLDFTAAFDGHDARRKVGIITSAEIVPERVEQPFRPANAASKRPAALAAEGNEKRGTRNSKLLVTGFLFARDFPEVVREIRLGSNSLGMSYEVTGARVRDLRDRIWTLDEVTFTGAAILRRDKAAYQSTSIELTNDLNGCHSERASFATRGTWASGAERGAASLNPRASLATLFTATKEKPMTPELTQQFLETSSRLAAAAESLEQAVARLDSDRDSLSTKVERIIAAVEDHGSASSHSDASRITTLEGRIAELERANSDLKAQASRSSARKTLPPLVTALLAKHGMEASERVDLATLDKTLAPLSVEQRMAVKAQMARAGIID